MRKHFLILMLLTLLPLAGWAAEPLSSVKLSVANVTYGTATLNPTTATDGTVTVYAVKPYQNATHYDQVGLEAVFNTSTIANPYYYWLRSIDNGSTWTEVFGASGYGSSYKGKYYR